MLTLEQRPDVRSAEEQMHAASAQIGVAVANRLPNITLSADLGSSATAITQLFTPGPGFWTLATNVAQPIFQGGTLLHRQRAAEEAYKQAAAQYRSTVLTIRIIIGHQNRWLSKRCQSMPSRLACRMGKLIINVAPFPGWLWAVIVPPCLSTILRQIARPIPVPSYSPLR